MPDTVAGVPIHPMVVHAVVVLIPLAALGVAALAVVPRWRDRYGVLVFTAALVATVLVPVATQSGELLEDLVREDERVERHADLGETMIFGAVSLLVMAIALWWLGRAAERGRSAPTVVSVLVVIVALVVAVGVTVQVVLVGHSGADAVWSASP
jgi:uncharacterized membrane protein